MQRKNSTENIQTESSSKELRFAKRINRNRVTKLKLRSKEVRIQICLEPNFKFSKSFSSCLYGRGKLEKDFGVGFIVFG